MDYQTANRTGLPQESVAALQQAARDAFDLDAFMESLPPDTGISFVDKQGRAGTRLRAYLCVFHAIPDAIPL